jgi:hypothetical protein
MTIRLIYQMFKLAELEDSVRIGRRARFPATTQLLEAPGAASGLDY